MTAPSDRWYIAIILTLTAAAGVFGIWTTWQIIQAVIADPWWARG